MTTDKTSSLDEDRLTSKIFQNLDAVVDRFLRDIQTDEADPETAEFWRDLQEALEGHVSQLYRPMLERGYTDLANTIRDLEQIGIRTAVEQLRATVEANPTKATDAETWDQFKTNLRTSIGWSD